jgi:predicted enzyme related to lactoylglutathione lyase
MPEQQMDPAPQTHRKETIMTATSTLTVAALNIDCADPATLVDFWGKVLDRPVSAGAVPGDMAIAATDPANGPRMIFHPVPESSGTNNTLRLILLTDHHDEETKRLTGLGAKPRNEIRLPAVRLTNFADPEGNGFDLVTWQSE